MPDTAIKAEPAPAALAPNAVPPTPESMATSLDRMLHNWQSRYTSGHSPSTVALAVMDWGAHTANAPFTSATMGAKAITQWRRLASVMMGGAEAIAPGPGDRRFADPAWQKPPFNVLTQAVLLGEEWWEQLVRNAPGVSPSNQRMLAFTVRQVLDMISPSNLPWANPVVINATRQSGGKNLAAGMRNFLRDQSQGAGAGAAKGFTVGKNLAATPGQVIFRNPLFELIQYTPTTQTVAAEPVLIVPAWIMKYYILDLSAGNSMVRWLVAQGHTVFMISWRNPGAELRDTSLDDYRTQGVAAAIDVVRRVCGKVKIHATGYCLGGTLLAITAAAMARDGDDRLASLSMFAAQTDFTEPGDLKLFITEDQLSFLNDIMQTQGYLDSAQMGSAFQMLQANDLIWGHAIRNYLLGEQDAPFDLMAWDADGTRLPARMHIEYLRHLYLNNDLAEGRLLAGARPLALNDLHLPIFLVGTERDQIAPWHSVFKLHLGTDGALTFVLTSGGHNAGIVSEPGHKGRHFRISTRPAGGPTLGPDEWQATTPPQDGSWWVEWAAWLSRHGATKQIAPPPMGSSLCDAPGMYVLEA
jgi:polyhydroxyalkanoate synthase